MDEVFEALAHPDRRALLDSLFKRDGQTVSELERQFPVTRFAVMKQLKILEAAHLVTSQRVGREKRHFLNPAPIRQVSDRWISRYAAPFVGALVELKRQAEARPMTDTRSMRNSLSKTASGAATGPRHVYEIFVRATAQTVWDILTDDAKTPLYQHFNMTSRTDWRIGGSISFFLGDRAVIAGELLELEPPSRLVMSFAASWSPEVAGDEPSRVTWEIRQLAGAACKITLTHDDFGGDTATSRQVGAGWPETLSRLKTLAETGQAFVIEADYAPHGG